MKNFKKNILLASLTLSLLASGCGVSKTDSNIKDNEEQAIEETDNQSIEEALDEYLVPYIEKRDALEQEIASLEEEIKELEEQKEKLQNEKTFYIFALDVMETSYEDNPSELFIIHGNMEYHDLFYASYTSEIEYPDIGVIFYTKSYPLFNFLTEEEITRFTQTGGKITTSQLDEILARLRENYHNGLYNDLFPESSNSLTLN